MRFSLLTLLLFTFWIGLGMAVWINRAPWQVQKETFPIKEFRPQAGTVSPDGRRALRRKVSWGYGPLMLFEITPDEKLSDTRWYFGSKEPLCEFDAGSANDFAFTDDDTIAFSVWKITQQNQTEEASKQMVIYKRRFPEWWWGHFFRVEVWLFALTGIALLLRGIRSIRERKRRVSALGTGRGISPGSSSLLVGTRV